MHKSWVVALMNAIWNIASLLGVALLGIGIFFKMYWTAFVVVVVTLIVCYLFFQSLNSKAGSLLSLIEQKENLSLSDKHLLGYPSDTFVAFDRQNRKLAFCHTSGKYEVHDFSHVLKWEIIWKETTEAIEMGEGAYTAHADKSKFKIRLHVSNIDQPILDYGMESRKQAEEWDARLNAMFNG